MSITDDHPTRPGLEEVLLRYFQAVDEGRPVVAKSLIDEHPHLAAELQAFFSGEALLGPLSTGGATPSQGSAGPSREEPPNLAGLLIEEELGRGGIGVVYRARDPRLGRDLAVKVLRVHYRDEPDARQRFVEEAQICAQLQHPGVVPVHARGTLADGRPYFAMKLIRGRTLRAMLADRSSPSDDLPRFLGAFEQVCQTVAYAHSQHVIHRDLKPENVMVGSFGEVQVMDWGLAKVLTRTGYTFSTEAPTPPIQTVRSQDDAANTDAGRALGTPAYMPPEQACGRVEELDERCDVFALGAILCDVLTGNPPYHGDYFQVIEQVRRGDVSGALARLDACGADAELIALARRCLTPDREARPRDAADVAVAVQTYQEGLRRRLQQTELERTAAAAREQEAVRVAAAERRARRRTAALAIALVVLLAGAGGAAWVHDQQSQQKAREETARRQTLEREIAAEVREVSALVEQGRSLHDQPARWGETLKAARDAGGRAERLLEAPETTEAMRQDVAASRRTLEEAERSQRLLTRIEGARSRLAESTGGVWNSADSAARYREAFREYGLDVLGGDREAVAAALRAHPLRERLLDALEEWQLLVSQNEPRIQLGRVIALAVPEPGAFRRRVREATSRADLSALQALARSEEARRLSPSATVTLATYLYILGNLSASVTVLRKSGEFDLRLLNSRDLPAHFQGREEALALLRQAVVRHPEDFWLNQTLVMILDGGDQKERDEELRYAAVSVALRPGSASARYSLALALDERADLQGAEASYRKALELDPEELRATINLGLLRLRQGDSGEALRLLEAASSRAPRQGRIHVLRGMALATAGRDAEALAALRQAVEHDAKAAWAHIALGVELKRQHDRPKAQAAFRDALQLDPDEPEANLLLADLLREAQELQEAEACYRRALAGAARLSPSRVAAIHQGLGRLYASRGDRKAALAALHAAADLDQTNPSIQAVLRRLQAEDTAARQEVVAFLKDQAEKNPSIARVHEELGDACQDAGDMAEAAKAYRKCLDLDPKNVVPWSKLGVVLLARKDFKGAEEALNEAIKRDPKHGPSHVYLAAALIERGEFISARQANQKGLELVPKHPIGLENRGLILEQSGDVVRAIEAYREAVAQSPRDAALRCRLGTKLGQRGDFRAALVEFQKAHEADDKHVPALIGEAKARVSLRDVDGAVAALRKLQPIEKNSEGLQLLGSLLTARGEWKGAATAMRDLAEVDQAIAPVALVHLTDCLLMQGKIDEAAEAAIRAVKLAPTQPAAHYSLGKVHLRARQYDDAARSYRKAVELSPRVAELRFALGGAYHMQGNYSDAAKEFQEAISLARPGEPRREFHALQKRYMDLILRLQPKLEEILKADKLPANYDELLALGDLCEKGDNFRPRAAVRVYSEAFALKPTQADEVITGHRMRAAAAAVQAAAGKGSDVADLTEGERDRLRRQGLKWLRADLAIYTQGFEALPPPMRATILTGLYELKIEPRLAPVRHKESLDKLSEDDRTAWKKFWNDVDALLKKIDDATR